MSDNLETIQKDIYSDIAKAIMAEWQRAHGTIRGTAHVMEGPQSLAIYIEEALCLAEQNLGQSPNNPELVTTYIKELMGHVCQEQISNIETAVQKKVVSTELSVDPAAGWVMFFFKFANSP